MLCGMDDQVKHACTIGYPIPPITSGFIDSAALAIRGVSSFSFQTQRGWYGYSSTRILFFPIIKANAQTLEQINWRECMNKTSCIMVRWHLRPIYPNSERTRSISDVIDCAPIYSPSTLAWPYSVDGWVDTTPIVGGDQVFVLSSKGRLHTLNAKTNVKNWDCQCSPATGTFELSVPAHHDGIVYIATSSGALNQGYCRVTALHASSGNECENITLELTMDTS